MNTIILAINPKYVQRIFTGEKKYEFRKIICKKSIDKILIYETAPTSKIVGEVTVTSVLKDTPTNLWELTKMSAGIDYDSFFAYFKNNVYAYSYVLENPIRYKKTRKIETYGLSAPPQNFVYLNKKPSVAGGA